VVPWVLYQRHGDAQLLDDQWSSMASWLTAFSDRAGVVLDFPDGGFMFGDWLDTAGPRTTAQRPGPPGSPWPPLPRPLGQDHGRGRRRARPDRGSRTARRTREVSRGAVPGRVRQSQRRFDLHPQTAYAVALELDLLAPEQRTPAGCWRSNCGTMDLFCHRHRQPPAGRTPPPCRRPDHPEVIPLPGDGPVVLTGPRAGCPHGDRIPARTRRGSIGSGGLGPARRVLVGVIASAVGLRAMPG